MSMSESLNHSFNQFNFRIIYWINHPFNVFKTINSSRMKWVSFLHQIHSNALIHSRTKQASFLYDTSLNHFFHPIHSKMSLYEWVTESILLPNWLKTQIHSTAATVCYLSIYLFFYFCTGAKKKIFFLLQNSMFNSFLLAVSVQLFVKCPTYFWVKIASK